MTTQRWAAIATRCAIVNASLVCALACAPSDDARHQVQKVESGAATEDFQERWLLLGANVVGRDTTWIDLATIERPSAGHVIAWFRMSGKGYHQIARMEFNCTRKRSRLLELNDYADPLFAVTRSQITDPQPWVALTPQSRGEAQLLSACQLDR